MKNEEVMMGCADGANTYGNEVTSEWTVRGFATRITWVFACIAFAIAVGVCMTPSNAYAADAETASEVFYVAGASDGHLWAKDIIEYDYADGKIISKPTVKQEASAVCKIQEGIRGPVYSCYFKDKAPKIKYDEGSQTATVKTYWVCKQGLNIDFLEADWHRTCTVTYKCDGDGNITMAKKLGKFQLG